MLRVAEHPETEAGGRCASMLGMPSDDQHSTDRVFVVAMFDCDRDAIDLHSTAPPVIGRHVDMLAMVMTTPTPGGVLVESWRDPGIPASTIAETFRRAADGYGADSSAQ